MTAADDELTPWERAFLENPGEPRGYQPKGSADTEEAPPPPPPGPAGASPLPEPTRTGLDDRPSVSG
ncbi:hypothetical protein BKA18_002045 [Streptomyces auratus]